MTGWRRTLWAAAAVLLLTVLLLGIFERLAQLQ